MAAIADVGPGRQFLDHAHTLKHLRSTQWRPRLICRNSYERWSADGRTSLLERAHERLNQILKTHTSTPMDEKKAAAVKAVVAGYK
jgi:trimethylamine--corrinoid protein Co-methyltransferase